MAEMEKNLIRKAIEKHRIMFPRSKRCENEECFVCEHGTIVFCFNTRDRSTHIEMDCADMSTNVRCDLQETPGILMSSKM